MRLINEKGWEASTTTGDVGDDYLIQRTKSKMEGVPAGHEDEHEEVVKIHHQTRTEGVEVRE